MKTAIVDDDEKDLACLASHLAQFFRESGTPYTLVTFTSPVDFLAEYRPDFDFIIFDIDMPQLDGIETARLLREKDGDVLLMFVTNKPQYALDGYAVDAIDYVLKPVSYPDFRLKMQKVMRFFSQNVNPRLSVHTVDGIVCLNVSDICYIESRLHYLTYHTCRGDFKTRGKLNEIEPQLTPYHFARASVSFLVNLKHVESMNGDVITVSGDTLTVSRSKKASFLSAFTKYIGGFHS